MTTWVLLIYTVPAAPTRKRAMIWRELKRLGAVYLHDGVSALPDRPDTRQALLAVGDRVREYDGVATMVEGARLDQETVDALLDQARSARQAEYEAVAQAAEQFLAHLQRETQHRVFTEREVTVLEADLAKLHRWHEQIRARDYVTAEGHEQSQELLTSSGEALEFFLDETFVHTDVIT
jgi:hypothetical protein